VVSLDGKIVASTCDASTGPATSPRPLLQLIPQAGSCSLPSGYFPWLRGNYFDDGVGDAVIAVACENMGRAGSADATLFRDAD